MKIEKAIGISDAKIQFVSLVDKAANKRHFLITKAENGNVQFSTTGKILKADGDSHYITGIVYEPLVEDAHGNFMTEEEIRKSAYWFAKNGDQVDLQHNFERADGVSVVENYVAPSDMTIADTPITKGTWVMTVEVNNPDIWEKVQKGEVTGFSMGGVGKYSETETELPAEKRGILKKLAEMLGGNAVEKSGRKISGKNRNTLQAIYDDLGKLLDECSEENKEEIILTKSEVEQIVDAAIQKALAGGKNGTEQSEPTVIPEVTAESIQKMVDEAVKKACAPEKETEPEPKPEMPPKKKPKEEDEDKKEKLTAESVQKMITAAVEKSLAPVLNARGLSSNLNGEAPVEKKEEPHYLAGLL